MNSSQIYSQQATNVSGALRYERVAILEATLNIKQKRQRQLWTRAFAFAGVVALTAVVWAMAAV